MAKVRVMMRCYLVAMAMAMAMAVEVMQVKGHGIEECLGDAGPESGPQSLSLVTLAATPGISMSTSKIYCILIVH